MFSPRTFQAISTSIPSIRTRTISTMKAIVINGKESTLSRDRPLPKLRDDYILVKTNCIALNPTDWKHIAGGIAAPNGLSGCDYSGTVEEVGSAVTKSFKKGDRVCGCAHGANASNPEDGVFAEYAVVKGDLQMRIPERMGFEEASTVSLGAMTCGQGLYQKALSLHLPTDPIKSEEYVLIYGGSSATGSLAVQFAKLSGYKVLTTCSKKHHSWLKSLGAQPFDYNEADVGSKIREFSNNSLKYAWDTISIPDSAKICSEALSSESGCKYGTILPVKPPRDDLEVTNTLMYTIFNEPFEKGGRMTEPSKEDFEFAKKFFGITEKLLAEGKLKTHPEKVGERGLEGALEGMQHMKEGKVSGVKLVYRVADTP